MVTGPQRTWTAETWPIGTALVHFPPHSRAGRPLQEAGADEWAEVLGQVKRAGFGHVDLTDTWLRPALLSDSQQRELRDLLSGLGLGVTAISLIRKSVAHPEPAKAQANLDYALATIETAARLGIGIVSVGLHIETTEEQNKALWFWDAPGWVEDLGNQDRWDYTVERLQVLGDKAAEHGVQVSLEMYEDTFLGTSDLAVKLVTAVDRATVHLNPDLNLVRLHRPIEPWREIIEKTLPHANYWHVKNFHRDEYPDRDLYFVHGAPLAEGFIDFRWALQHAVDIGFNGPLTIEHYGGDSLSIAASGHDYLRRVLAEALA
ncbi:sugar phosphate isomerase/epimerase family protein [Streptomyces shenzhenensis]|uniref:sugar phosphate isomerase/epimerase family protein n=1 Tax=Streptomyces shenzhenensis TaxID=943815 RepID=UPI00380562E0